MYAYVQFRTKKNIYALRIPVITLAFVLVATLAHSQTTVDSGSRALAFTHVTVIDATGSAAQPDMTVVIEGGRILAIGRSADLRVPSGAQVIDATGKFLIPGLVDMHVHTSWDEYFVRPLMLANGVTGMREMFAQNFAAIKLRRRAVEAGDLSGPRILEAGPIVDGPGGPWPGSIIVANGAEARAAVDKIKSDGYDYVKVYSALGRDAYFAIADEARKVGISFAGHVPGSVSTLEASDAGQKSFEHLYSISLSCSTREHELRTAPLSYVTEQQAEIDSFSEEKAAALFATYKKNGTWQVPTLVVMRNAAFYADPEYARTFDNPARLRYAPFALKMMWNLGIHFAPKMTTRELETNRKYFQWELQVVGEMQRAGVGILAGTDTPNPFVYPGYGLHDELALLVQSGLTPMEALQAATRNPAQFFGRLDSMGTIEKGKIADLDLLDADPLLDIHNTSRINAVVLGGKLIPREGLDALLDKAANNRWRANPAALTLLNLVLHMMRKVLYIALLVLVTGLCGISYFLRRRRVARGERILAELSA